jgi:thioredoxin-like negative regulator of GroEL
MRAAVLVVVLAACDGGAQVAAPAEPKSVQINEPGAAVDATAAVRDGYVTVVDFWSQSCGACVIVGGMLAAQIADQPRVLVRKIDVGDGDTAVAHAYQIGALPHFNVYDTHRRLRFVLVGNDCLDAPKLAKQLLAEQ